MRIAIVGSGIAGNVAAYLLHAEHEITLFEAADYAGGHTNTLDVTVNGRSYAVDTGFIVFNEQTYPCFIRLLGELGVRSKPTTMSFSVRSERTGLEWASYSLDTVFADRWNLVRPRFLRMLADLLRFNRTAPRLLADPRHDALTLGEFLARERYSAAFVEEYVVPLGAAIWSTHPARMLDFPARFFVRFLDNHEMTRALSHPRWRVIEGGSREYVRALTRGFADRIRLRTPVERIRRHETHVEVTPRGGAPERFDHVVVATHADTALALLADPTDREREVLGALPYQENVAVLHTDERVLPRRRRAWASWNYLVPASPSERVAVTYDMNRLQGIEAPVTFCVSLGDQAIDPSKVLRRIVYHHPLFTTSGVAAQRRHAEVSGVGRTSYCGAYWRHGFHEDGVVSAIAVAKALGASAGVRMAA